MSWQDPLRLRPAVRTLLGRAAGAPVVTVVPAQEPAGGVELHIAPGVVITPGAGGSGGTSPGNPGSCGNSGAVF